MVEVIVHEELEKFRSKVDKFELIVAFLCSFRQIPESQWENIKVLRLVVVKDNFVPDFGDKFWAFGESLKKVSIFFFSLVKSTLNVRLLIKWQTLELVNNCFDILDVPFIS